MSYACQSNTIPDCISRDLDLAREESENLTQEEEMEVLYDVGYGEWLEKKLRREGI